MWTLILNLMVISIANFKGGVGKSTTAQNLAAGMALQGKRILLIDTDAQANLTESFGFNLPEGYEDYLHSAYLGIRDAKPKPLAPLRISDKLHLVPSSLDLANADSEFNGVGQRFWMLKKLLKEVKHKYDHIIIDCPPSMGLLTKNALSASDLVLIPTLAEYLPTRGIKLFIDAVGRFIINEGLNEEIAVLGILITQYNANPILSRELEKGIIEQFPDDILQTRIRRNIALSEAQAMGKDIFAYDAESNGAKDYQELTNEILNLLQ